MISTPITIVLVAAQVGLAGLLVAGIALAARAERTAGGRPGVGYLVAADLILAWATVAFLLSDDGVFASTSQTTVPVIAFAIVLPVLLGCVLIGRPAFRARVDRIPVHWLVGVQFYRVIGGLFLIAYLENHMPPEFALPAGIGDMLVGLSAPFVARTLARDPERGRAAGLTWCVLGIADLVVAVTCGFLPAPSVFEQLALSAPNAAITQYPFVLIPTFAVPASILLHAIVIARLRRPVPARAAAAAGAAAPAFQAGSEAGLKGRAPNRARSTHQASRGGAGPAGGRRAETPIGGPVPAQNRRPAPGRPRGQQPVNSSQRREVVPGVKETPRRTSPNPAARTVRNARAGARSPAGCR